MNSKCSHHNESVAWNCLAAASSRGCNIPNHRRFPSSPREEMLAAKTMPHRLQHQCHSSCYCHSQAHAQGFHIPSCSYLSTKIHRRQRVMRLPGRSRHGWNFSTPQAQKKEEKFRRPIRELFQYHSTMTMYDTSLYFIGNVGHQQRTSDMGWRGCIFSNGFFCRAKNIIIYCIIF